jgi:hypothetical protein
MVLHMLLANNGVLCPKQIISGSAVAVAKDVFFVIVAVNGRD